MEENNADPYEKYVVKDCTVTEEEFQKARKFILTELRDLLNDMPHCPLDERGKSFVMFLGRVMSSNLQRILFAEKAKGYINLRDDGHDDILIIEQEGKILFLEKNKEKEDGEAS